MWKIFRNHRDAKRRMSTRDEWLYIKLRRQADVLNKLAEREEAIRWMRAVIQKRIEQAAGLGRIKNA